MARQLTAKQNKFIDGVVDGLSSSEAYRQAYNAENMSTESIATQAYKTAAKPHIAHIIAQRRKDLANKVIWDREQALTMLKDIAVQAQENILIKDDDGEKIYYNAAASNAAIKAIEGANKMCGYNEPEKVNFDGEVKVILDGELSEWAK
ncbi:MAG: hypothetical protein RRZ73_05680 [Oscillospiraceae bacterium]